MEKLVVANWKANLSLNQAEQWLTVFSEGYSPIAGLRVVLAVPSLFLVSLQNQFKSLPGVAWAAQDVSSYPLGSYTGSVPAALLTGLVDYALVGHRERRKYFRETIQDTANKVSEALEEDIRPILCVDMDIARQQSASVEFDDFERLTVAYTPSDADHLEIARNVSAVADGVDKIGALFPGAPVLYGGGVNEKNIAELFRVDEMAGVMVAGGCLDPLAFIRLMHNAEEALDLK